MGGGGADSGQASSGGWLSGLMSWKAPWASGDPAQLASGGVAGSGPGEVSAEAESWTDKLKAGVAQRMAGGLPGYGDLWAIGADGVEVTRAGKIVLGAMLAGVALLMMEGKR